jgi:hypothetical protein
MASVLIDKNIHLFWMQGESHLRETHPLLYENKSSWTDIYSGFKFYTWDYDSLLNLIQTEYSEFLSYFLNIETENLSKLHILVKQMDFAKWFVFHKYGGMYVDRDMVAITSIEPTIQFSLNTGKFVIFPFEIINKINFTSKDFHKNLYNQQLCKYNFIYQDAWSYHSKNHSFGLDFVNWVINTDRISLPVFDSFSIISLTEFIVSNKRLDVIPLDYNYIMRGDLCNGWAYHTFEGGWT